MAEPLRPLSLGELLDRAIQLYRRRFGLFVGIAAAPFGVLLALQVAANIAGVSPTVPPGGVAAALGRVTPAMGLWLLASEIIGIVALAYAMGGTVWAVSHLHLGEATSIGRSLGEMKGHVGGVAFTMIATGVCAVAPLVAAAVVGAVFPAVTGAGRIVAGLLMFVLVVAGFVAAVWIWLRLAVAVPAVVLEDLGLFAALRRSAALTKGFLGRVFLIYLLAFALEVGVIAVFTITLALFHGTHQPVDGAWRVLGLGTGFLAHVLVTPVLTIGLALVFFDCKVRKEAFDIEILLRRNASTAV